METTHLKKGASQRKSHHPWTEWCWWHQFFFHLYVSKALWILILQSLLRVVKRHSGDGCFGLVHFDMFQIETFNPTKKYISGNLHWGWFKGTLGTVVLDWYILICFKLKLSTPLKILLWQSSLRLVKRHSGHSYWQMWAMIGCAQTWSRSHHIFPLLGFVICHTFCPFISVLGALW